VQIDFDILKDSVATSSTGMPPASEQNAVPAVSPVAATVKLPKYRRMRISGMRVASFVGDSAASIRSTWKAFADPCVDYICSVSRSFIRDCRLLLRVLASPLPSLQLGTSPDDGDNESTRNRNVIAPVVNWLRQPFSPGQVSRNRAPSRYAERR
jgi:hypothetical protein